MIHYLVLIVLLWELDVDVVLGADVGDDGALAADDFGVILGVHSDGQLEAPECLQRGRHKDSGLQLTPDSFILLLTYHGKVYYYYIYFCLFSSFIKTRHALQTYFKGLYNKLNNNKIK